MPVLRLLSVLAVVGSVSVLPGAVRAEVAAGSILEQVLQNLAAEYDLTSADSAFFINFAENKGSLGADGLLRTVVTGAISTRQQTAEQGSGAGQVVIAPTEPPETGHLSTSVVGSSNAGKIHVVSGGYPSATGTGATGGQSAGALVAPFLAPSNIMLNGAANRVSIDGSVQISGPLQSDQPGSVATSAIGAVNSGAVKLGLQGNGGVWLLGHEAGGQ